MLRIVPIAPARLADFFTFLERDAFADNPRWASCYCQCFYEDHRQVDWPARTAAENKACATRRAAEGSMQGLLAYEDGRVIGWCNAAPRPLLHALDEEPIADADTTGTIVCFLVSPAARGRGVATALLDAACEGLRAQGLRTVEANPRLDETSDAENHYGPLRMYLRAGFEITRDDGDGSVWVRKSL
ncbi:MAG: GNAT family N-acetyltransferase [bacterium]